jgi:GNAT superfamily N-acetyltransferase
MILVPSVVTEGSFLHYDSWTAWRSFSPKHIWIRDAFRPETMAMGSNYEIVRYRPDLKRQVVALQTTLWSPNLALNTAYFEWKYERNPYLKEPLIYLAISSGSVIGMRGFFGVRWESGIPAQRFTSLYADDALIAPEHRRHGLMTKIMSLAFEDLAARGYDYVFNLSAVPANLRLSLSMGWRSAGWVHPMCLQSWRLAVESGVRRQLKKIAALRHLRDLALARRQLSHAASEYPSSRSLFDTKWDQTDPVFLEAPAISVKDAARCEAMADLVSRIGSDGRTRHVRDSEYFRWRFQNPLSRYRFLFCEEHRDLAGYLVLQEYTSSRGRNIVNIVDWEATNATVQTRLLQAAATFSKGRRMMIWSATLPQPVVALLERHGFRSVHRPPEPADPAIIVRSIRRNDLAGEWTLAGRNLRELASWDMRMLYSSMG